MAKAFASRRLSLDVVANLKPGETVMDTIEPGLGVRNQSGSIVYFVRKFARGRRHFTTIGQHGTGGLTVTSARHKAKRIIVGLRDGMDPAEQRAKDRGMPTVAEFADRWLETHVDAKLKPSTKRLYRSTVRTIINPGIGRVRVDQVGQEHIAKLHLAHRATPYAANRALAVLSKMLNVAERERLRPRGSNPVRGLERFREQRRERFLSQDEIKALGAALSSPEIVRRHSAFAVSAIVFLVLTGMRRNEVLNLRWSEVDLERGMLLLDDSKTGRKPVLLGQHALQVLERMPRLGGTSGKFVFPGTVDGQPLQDIKKAWHTVRDAAGLDGVRLHDLRHSFAAQAASAGGSLPMIGRLLGHTQPQTTARYAHLAADPVRDLANRASSSIAYALGADCGTREPMRSIDPSIQDAKSDKNG